MPVLESTDNITPRSALRHRPITDEKTHAGKRSIVTSATTPVVQRASRPRPGTTDAHTDTQDEVAEWQRAGDDKDDNAPKATAIPNSPVRRASAAGKNLPKTPLPQAVTARSKWLPHAHPLLYLGLGMLMMLALWTILMGVASWLNTTLDDIHYGRPRTFQTDEFVGHNESSGVPSHFIAINLHSHIEVIEMPGGDAAHARIYMGPQLYNSGSDLVPITLKFVDVNGDHLKDMIICFQGSQVVFINDQGGFRPLRPDEHHQVEQFLQHLGQ